MKIIRTISKNVILIMYENGDDILQVYNDKKHVYVQRSEIQLKSSERLLYTSAYKYIT